MAFNLPLLALVLLVAAIPLSHGQLLGNTVNAGGRLCCSPNGNCLLGGQGISGATVNLTCANLVTGVLQTTQGITNGLGIFNLTLNNLPISVLSGPSCIVTLSLPLNQTICPILNTVNGTLVGVVSRISPIISSVLGLLRIISIGLFIGVGA